MAQNLHGEERKISRLRFAQNVSSIPLAPSVSSLSRRLVANEIRPETSTTNHKKQAGQETELSSMICLSVNQSLPGFCQDCGQHPPTYTNQVDCFHPFTTETADTIWALGWINYKWVQLQWFTSRCVSSRLLSNGKNKMCEHREARVWQN